MVRPGAVHGRSVPPPDDRVPGVTWTALDERTGGACTRSPHAAPLGAGFAYSAPQYVGAHITKPEASASAEPNASPNERLLRATDACGPFGDFRSTGRRNMSSMPGLLAGAGISQCSSVRANRSPIPPRGRTRVPAGTSRTGSTRRCCDTRRPYNWTPTEFEGKSHRRRSREEGFNALPARRPRPATSEPSRRAPPAEGSQGRARRSWRAVPPREVLGAASFSGRHCAPGSAGTALRTLGRRGSTRWFTRSGAWSPRRQGVEAFLPRTPAMGFPFEFRWRPVVWSPRVAAPARRPCLLY